jgi:16S rRNA (adenine1518-N6/adenine1519-N6)-dimethyltransferase
VHAAGRCAEPRLSRPPRDGASYGAGRERGDDRDADGFRRDAKKSLGQNFLHERSVIEKILLAVDPKPGDRIVEIGPGQGALTLPMLDRHGALTAIEFDRDLLEPLAAAAQSHGALTLVHADVLDVDFTALAAAGDGDPGDPGDPADRRLRLVGNLPYNLSSPILFHALDHAAAIRDMHFMLQKEVVDRMAAGPGSKVYGRLSVMLQAECTVTPLFKVAPGAFRPAPKVDSAVVRLVPRPPGAAGITDRGRFAAVVRAAVGQRRKTLRNALGGLMDAAAIEAAGLRPDARAEQVPVDGFVRLANLPAAVSPPPG